VAAAKKPRMPSPAPSRMVALLRGINVGGHKKVPMQQLRELAIGIGGQDVATYIQSGNLVLSTTMAPVDVEVALEQALRARFGFDVDVVVRTASQWQVYAGGTPFPDAEAERPHMLLLGLAKLPLKPGAAEGLRAYARAGERVEVRGDALWVDLPAGAGTSKVTPAVLDRLVGSSVTTRNWRTVQKLAAMSA
jgi:uncharacterized protein (DUF1697 family)